MITSKKGFTLIELLLVVVIIGIVAAFVLPKFGDVKEKAYVSAMKNDLRNLATEQEIYFSEHKHYIPENDATNDLLGVSLSEGVDVAYTDMNLDCFTYSSQRWCIPGAVITSTDDGLVEEENAYLMQASHEKTDLFCAQNLSSYHRDIAVWNSETQSAETVADVDPGEIVCQSS